MATRLYALARRREHLIARSAAERAQLAEAANHLRRPLALADAALRAVHFVKSHPIAFGVVAIAASFYIRPRKALGWVGRGVMAYRLFSGIRKVLK